MKRFFVIITLVTSCLIMAQAQDDDMYFASSKKAKKTEAQKKSQAITSDVVDAEAPSRYRIPADGTVENKEKEEETYYCGSLRSVDEYNRRDRFNSSYAQHLQDSVRKQDSVVISREDYENYRKLQRFEGYRNVTVVIEDPWYDPWYNPFYYGTRWSWSVGFMPWYDPWYDPWYRPWGWGIAWGGWSISWGGPYWHHTWYGPRYVGVWRGGYWAGRWTRPVYNRYGGRVVANRGFSRDRITSSRGNVIGQRRVYSNNGNTTYGNRQSTMSRTPASSDVQRGTMSAPRSVSPGSVSRPSSSGMSSGMSRGGFGGGGSFGGARGGGMSSHRR